MVSLARARTTTQQQAPSVAGKLPSNRNEENEACQLCREDSPHRLGRKTPLLRQSTLNHQPSTRCQGTLALAKAFSDARERQYLEGCAGQCITRCIHTRVAIR